MHGSIKLIMEEDGDIILEVIQKSNFKLSLNNSAQVQSCSSGGKSPKVKQALINLAKAIEETNQESKFSPK